MKKLRILLTVALGAVIFGIAAGSHSLPAQQRREKARYYFFEGVRREISDTAKDAVYELNRRAHRADPTYPEAASAYGLSRLLNELDTFQTAEEAERSLDMMRTLVDAYPADYLNAEYYAYLSQLLGESGEAKRVLRMVDSLNPDRTSALMGLARIYASEGDYDATNSYLERYESREGDDPDITIAKLTFMLQKQDTTAALAEAARMMGRHPQDIEYVLLMGQLQMQLGRPDSALSYYRRSAELDTASAIPKMAMAEAFKAMGDSTGYDEMTYRTLLSEDLGVSEKTGMLAEYLQTLLNDKSDTRRGDHLFEVLSAQYPHDPEVLDLAARYNSAKGNFPAAIEQIGYALDQNRTNENYWGQLMTYQLGADRYADAMKTYEEATKIIGKSPGMNVLYATAAQMNKEYDKALAVFTGMIADIDSTINPVDTIVLSGLRNRSYEELVELSNYFTSMGDIYYQAADTAKAFRSYDNALKIIDNNPLTLNNYAYFLCESGGDLEKAARMSELSIQMSPDNPTFMDTYAWILFRRHDYPKALQYQAAAVELIEKAGAGSADVYSHYGDILFMNGKPAEAVAFWQKALDTDKDELSEKDRKLLRKKIDHKTFFYE